jgi:hypothetical protein
MDLNEREAHVEKSQKQYEKLKESFKKIFQGTLLTEKKLVTDAGKKLLKNVTKLKEEDTEETKKDEVLPDEPKADDAVVPPVAGDVPPVAGDVPPVAGDVPPVAGDVPPAPVSVNAPEGTAMANSQDQLATTEFVKQFMKGLPSDINMETSVDSNGIFKAPVNDQHEGQFVVVVYPATKNVHEVADLLEPALPAPALPAPAVTGDVPPAVDAGAVPPVTDPAAVPPVAGDVPPAAPAAASPLDAPAGDVPPAEIPVEPKDDEEEMKEDTVCENEKCMDESCKTHGGKKMMEAECEDEESKLEKQRDPMMEGRKNWKSYQKALVNKQNKEKILKEETATAEKKELGEVEKAERRVAAIKKQIEDETDAEEKKALKADLEKAESALNKAKTAGHNKKALDKVVDSIPRKSDSED